MGTAVEEGLVPERIYVHQLNLTSADLRRRQRDKEMVEEEKRKVLEMKEIKRRQKEEEKRRDMEMLLSYDPWGKPGAGAKGGDSKRKKYPEGRVPDETVPEEETMEGFIRKFGKPGAGAPIRTESGRIRTQIPGHPDIRFQDTQHVRLSIENHLRYKNEDKENYRGNLNELIQQKHLLQEQEKEWESKKLEEMRELYPFGREANNNGGSYLSHADPMFMATRPKKLEMKNDEYSLGLRRNRGGDGAPHLTESGHQRTRLRNTLRNIKMMGPHIDESSDVYYPWGKPGGGAPFVREDGKPFEEKLGWSLTGHPKKRSKEAKREYRSELEKEMEKRRQREQQERLQDPGAELVTLIRQGAGGGARKNPVTGEILPCHRLLTDVTKERLDIRRAKSQETLLYHSELAEQAEQRRQMRELQRQAERAQSEKHVSTWDSFWGRPGHGAPRDPENHKKENIDNLLMGTKPSEPYVKHYVREIVPSKHKNRYEYPTKDVMVLKRDYEFRTPFPATEAS